MSGPSGSGKSTAVRERWPVARVFSADSFFMASGDYRFDASKLSEAHATCLRGFIEYIRKPHTEGVVVVDNTNCTAHEIAPYYAAAEAYGWPPFVARMEVNYADLDMMARRNAHGVPIDVIDLQTAAFLSLHRVDFPRWWKRVGVPVRL